MGNRKTLEEKRRSLVGGGFTVDALSECKDGHKPSPLLLLLTSFKLTCSNTWLLMNALHTVITCLQPDKLKQ